MQFIASSKVPPVLDDVEPIIYKFYTHPVISLTIVER